MCTHGNKTRAIAYIQLNIEKNIKSFLLTKISVLLDFENM